MPAIVLHCYPYHWGAVYLAAILRTSASTSGWATGISAVGRWFVREFMELAPFGTLQLLLGCLRSRRFFVTAAMGSAWGWTPCWEIG